MSSVPEKIKRRRCSHFHSCVLRYPPFPNVLSANIHLLFVSRYPGGKQGFVNRHNEQKRNPMHPRGPLSTAPDVLTNRPVENRATDRYYREQLRSVEPKCAWQGTCTAVPMEPSKYCSGHTCKSKGCTNGKNATSMLCRTCEKARSMHGPSGQSISGAKAPHQKAIPEWGIKYPTEWAANDRFRTEVCDSYREFFL